MTAASNEGGFLYLRIVMGKPIGKVSSMFFNYSVSLNLEDMRPGRI